MLLEAIAGLVIPACLAALIAALLNGKIRRGSLISGLMYLISSFLFFFITIITLVFIFYALKDPEYYVSWWNLISPETYFVPIAVNAYLLAVILPVLFFALLPSGISDFIDCVIERGGFFLIAFFCLASATRLQIKWEWDIFDYTILEAYLRFIRMIAFNAAVLALTCLSVYILRKVNRDRLDRFVSFSNYLIYAAAFLAVIFVLAFIPDGLVKIVRSYNFSLRVLECVVIATIAVSAVLAFTKLKVPCLPESGGSIPASVLRLRGENAMLDDRTYRQRFLRALPACLFPVSEYFVFKPFELFFANSHEFGFVFSDFALLFIFAAILCTVLFSALAGLLRGKIYDAVICLSCGIGTASWLQSSFLNPELGVMDGIRPDWSGMGGTVILNLLIWVVVIAAFFLLKKYSRQWLTASSFIALALSFSQLVGLVGFALTGQQQSSEPLASDYYADNSLQLCVSENDNTIILILDCFTSTFLDEMLAEYPDALDFMTDFVCYDNYEPMYFKTFPAMTHMLTGNKFDPSLTVAEWFDQSWSSDSAEAFYSALHENGYITTLYGQIVSDTRTLYGELSQMYGKIDNIMYGSPEGYGYSVKYAALFRNMVKLAAYTMLPDISKPYYYLDTDSVNSVLHSDNLPAVAEADFYNALLKQGLTAIPNQGMVTYQHLASIYGLPVDENCRSASVSTPAKTAAGCMVLVEEYVNQLKELGVYDRSTIIVTADHGLGNKEYSSQCIFFIKEKNASGDGLQISHAPISAAEMMSTILFDAGISAPELGPTIFDIDENTPRERTFIQYAYDPSYPVVPKYFSVTDSNYNIYRSFTYTGDRSVIDQMFIDDNYVIIPMVESYE